MSLSSKTKDFVPIELNYMNGPFLSHIGGLYEYIKLIDSTLLNHKENLF